MGHRQQEIKIEAAPSSDMRSADGDDVVGEVCKSGTCTTCLGCSEFPAEILEAQAVKSAIAEGIY